MPSPRLLTGRHSRVSYWYAVTTISSQRRPLFVDPAIAAIVSNEIAACEVAGMLESCARVIMPDHLHWLFQLQGATLGRCMQVFKSRSATAIRKYIGGCGAVWQAGYYDHWLRDGEDLVRQAEYIVSNPLRAGLAERIEDYPHWWARHIAKTEHLV